MDLQPQQKKILNYMDQQQGYRDYKEMAKELEINVGSFSSQMTKLGSFGLVEKEAEDSGNYVITQEGRDVVARGGSVLSREDVGLNERQIFEQRGRALGGMTDDKLHVISDAVFTSDPHNLDLVWEHLCSFGVPIDIRRGWWASWRSYLSKGGKPPEVSEATLAQVTSPKERTEEQKKQAEKMQLDYDIEVNPQTGFAEIVKIGTGVGQYTIDEASKVVGVRNQQVRAMAMLNPPQQHQDSVSTLITALTPLLKKDTDEGVLRDLITLQFGNMTKAITEAMPKTSEKKSDVEQFVGFLGMLKEIGPTLRPILGIPEHPPQPANTATPIQVVDSDGKPMVLNLGDLITLKKFEAEQKREEVSAKNREDFMQTVRGFIDRIGKAAERAAQQ